MNNPFPRGAAQSHATVWTSVVLTTAALYFAREIFIPIALALLLTFLLGPLVTRLHRWGWSKLPAVIAVVVFGFLIIAFVGALVTFQLVDLTESLPEYRENIQAKVKAFTPAGGRIFSETRKLFEPRPDDLQKTTNTPTKLGPTSTTPTPERLPVEIRKPASTYLEVMQAVSANLFGPLTKAGIVIVFVIFMLFQREDLRDRLLRLLGSNQLNVTTQALDDAAKRVSRYLFMQLVVNASYGIPIGLGLYFIGIPNPLLWGVLAMLLRFIPYVGPVIASILPIGLALAVDPGWMKPALTISLFIVLELVSNNLVEPWLYGASTGISSFAVIVAAVFWTWLWGPIGLLLSTPLTVCLAVLGRHVPSLRFLHIILTDEPALSEHARFYQRLLARKSDEALELAEDILKNHPLEHLYNDVIIPALSLAEHDRHEGSLDDKSEKYILENTKEIVAELGALDPSDKISEHTSPDTTLALCIPANDAADEICAVMLMQVLRKAGIAAKALSVSSLTNEYLEEIKSSHSPVVCVSALPPSTIRQARLFCKRLRSEFPELKVVLGIWTKTPDLERIQARVSNVFVDYVVTNIREAVEIIRPITTVSK